MAFTDFKDGVSFSALSATPAAFYLLGGRYAFCVTATFGGGNIQLQILMPDGTTYIGASAAVTTSAGAAGCQVVDLPPGTYQIAITTSTAVQGSLIRVPYRAA